MLWMLCRREKSPASSGSSTLISWPTSLWPSRTINVNFKIVRLCNMTNSLWIKPTDALNSNFIGITTWHVSGNLSAQHQEFLAVNRHWYISCSFDNCCYQFWQLFSTRSRMEWQCMTTVQHLKTCMTDGWMTLVLTADPCQKISSYGEMYEVS
jgi:hypothetical protein